MNRKVYTYRTIKELRGHPRFSEITQYPHITATADLFRAVKQNYPEIRDLMDIHILQKGMIADWEDPNIAFQQFINISKVIRNLRIDEREKVIHGSFIKNKTPVLNAIRLLTEADIYPEDIVPSNTEEQLFKRIWEDLDNEDESFCDFRVAFAAYMDEPEKFLDVISNIAPCLSANTIILHGFYFITPIQERIFDMLENCGKELVFLCCIDDKVPEVGEIWYKVLSTENKFEAPEKWVTDIPREMKNRPFGSLFGEKPDFSPMRQVSVIKYGSEIEFVRDVERLRDADYTIFSADTKATDELLREFYPEIYKRRHLLAYPVGQYIYRLHTMWSTKDQCLHLTIDDVQACFASGWVEYQGVNAKKYVENLERLRTYVSDCNTIDEWESRLNLLQQTKENVLAAFEAHLDTVPEQNRRWHRVMADPLLNLSCFDHDTAALQKLIDMIRHLIRTAKTLFTDTGEISIATHLTRVRNILKTGRDEKSLLAEEKAVIKELDSRLKHPELGVSKCLPGEIAEAIVLIIGGGILDEDNYTIQSGEEETFVKSLYQIESAPLLSKGKVHLCFADEMRLPGKSKPYVWPINNAFLNRLLINKAERRYQYLQDMRFVIDNAPLANRYLFYSLLQNDVVEISWIAADGEKEVASSPYIQVLEQIFHIHPASSPNKSTWSNEAVMAIEAAKSALKMKVDLERETALEAKLDVSLCPWRYIYGYVLAEIPAFASDFHYSFVLSNLIGAIVKVSGATKKDVGKEVLELFPYLRSVEKQQIMDHVPTIKLDDTDSMDAVSYPQARLLIHFLTPRIKAIAEETLGTRFEDGSSYETDLNGDVSHDLCLYCPHNAVCPRADHNGVGRA